MMNNLLSLTNQQEGIIQDIIHPDEEMKRRLFDLGFYQGSKIKKTLVSPKGDPIAYKIRGTTIALRNSDAQYVLLKEVSS